MTLKELQARINSTLRNRVTHARKPTAQEKGWLQMEGLGSTRLVLSVVTYNNSQSQWATGTATVALDRERQEVLIHGQLLPNTVTRCAPDAEEILLWVSVGENGKMGVRTGTPTEMTDSSNGTYLWQLKEGDSLHATFTHGSQCVISWGKEGPTATFAPGIERPSFEMRIIDLFTSRGFTMREDTTESLRDFIWLGVKPTTAMVFQKMGAEVWVVPIQEDAEVAMIGDLPHLSFPGAARLSFKTLKTLI